MAQLVALAWHARCPLALGFWLLLLLVLAEMLAVVVVVYWLYSLGGVPSDALVSMLGQAHRHVDGALATEDARLRPRRRGPRQRSRVRRRAARRGVAVRAP